MALARSDYLFDTSTSMGEAVSTSMGVLMQTRGLRLWIKLFKDADTQANSITIPLYTPITALLCNMNLHRCSIPYMGYLITAEVEGGGGLCLLDSLGPLMIYQA